MVDTYAYVYKPMKLRTTIFGCGWQEWLKIAAVAAIGALLAWLLGYWVQPTEVSLNYSERLEQVEQLQDQRDAAARIAAITGSSSSSSGSASTSDQELALEGEENGITAKTTDDEIESMVPMTKIQNMPVIPDVQRWMVFFFAPALITFGLNAELIHNSSLLKELRRVYRNWRAQHDFSSRPEEFMQRLEGGAER